MVNNTVIPKLLAHLISINEVRNSVMGHDSWVHIRTKVEEEVQMYALICGYAKKGNKTHKLRLHLSRFAQVFFFFWMNE